MRNQERDEAEMAERREQLLTVGFRLFSQKSIESVRLQEIATASGIGIATLYRYFVTKPELVIEIGTRKWQEYHLLFEKAYQERSDTEMNAAEELDFFLDCFIELYRNHRDFLRFLRNFDTYVMHEGCTEEQMKPYNDALSVFSIRFHTLYRKAQEDKTLSIRTSEKKMFVNTLHVMLSVTEKYAEGLTFPPDLNRDMTEELYMLKHMIYDTYAK